MKFMYADWLLACDEKFTIIKNGAIAFDEKIIDIGTIEEFKTKYINEDIEYLGYNSVIMPGLINTHVHLEFSANKTTLKYGNFVKWLFSVIKNREELIEKATEELIDSELNKMVQNGTTTIGAISSYGFDMNSCIKSALNVVYFTEVLGSKPEMIDTLFLDFQEKLNNAITHNSDKFIPAIAIHSAYSTHPFLIREVLKIAREKNMIVSAHFQESKAENDWLMRSSGEFETFFKDMLDQQSSFAKPSEFLEQFKNIKHLSFTHCVEANEKELEQMGTDGLSSNNTLNMFEEIKNAFFMHTNLDSHQLADKLILAATKGGADALGLQKGSLIKEYDSDIITFTLPDVCQSQEDLTTDIILHSPKITHTFIKGTDELNK